MTATDQDAQPAAGAPTAPAEPKPDRPGGPAQAAPAAGGHGAAAPSSGLPQLARILGAVVAPTTLLTSLLLYFGRSHAYYFFDYFGVNWTLLGLTSQDYLLRSLDGLFVPMTVLACVALLVLWGHTALHSRLAAGSRPRALRVLLPVMGIIGLVLAVGGLWSIVEPTVLSRYLVAAPLSLAVGVPLLGYTVHLWRSLSAGPTPGRPASGPTWVAVAEWAGMFLLVGLSLFWAANDYSTAVGTSRARQFVAQMPGYPSTVVYSERSLNLHAPGIHEVRCKDPEAAYHFRYDGLKLVLQSGNQYLFLPAGWTPGDGVAILMPRTDALRLEFLPSTAIGTGERSTC